MRCRLTLLALPPLLLVAAGCQLCGLDLPRCQPPGDPFRACGPDDFCADDGFCRPVPRAPVTGDCSQRDDESAVRRLRLGFGTGGASAMSDRLGDVDAALSCGGDFSACDLAASGPVNSDVHVPVSLRAADDTGTTASLDRVTFRSAAPPIDIEGGFALEAVFRMPSTPVAAPIVAMSDGSTGWELGTDSQGYLGLAVGDQVLGLSFPTLRTWHHVLCVVNTPSLLAGGDDDDILCVLDGVLLQTRFPSSGGSPLFGGPLSVGSYADGLPVADAAVAALRLWQGDPLAGLTTSSARQDALVDAGNNRLARFHGIAIDAPSDTLRIMRLGTDFFGLNVKAQPITQAGLTRFELVPARWPRTGIGGAEVGLLVEAVADNLVAPASTLLPCLDPVPVGTPAVGPGGAPGACDFGETTQDFAGTAAAVESFVPDRDDLTFSVFVQSDGLARLRVDDTTCVFSDGVLDTSGRGNGDCLLVDDFAGGFVRVVARAARPPAGAPWEASLAGTVWSPQLEIGSDATTPFVVPVATAEGFQLASYRVPDVVALERIGLTRGDATSATVTVMPLGDLDIGDVTLSESIDRVRNLVLNLEETDPGVVVGGGLLQDDFAAIEMRGLPLAWDGSSALTFGVDLGTPVVRCGERCNAGVGTGNTESPGQWEVLRVSGSGGPFVLTDVDVSTRGAPPLDVAFELQPEVAPTGCFAGRTADIALVGCEAQACTEGSTSRVVWKGAVEATTPGPGLGETAVSGSLVAEHLSIEAAALYFEVRFAPAGDGPVLVLEDEDGPMVGLVVDQGLLLLERRDVAERVPMVVLNPTPQGRDDTFIPYPVQEGTWVQASCWVGPETACATNMDYLQFFPAPAVETTITRARVGEAAAAVSFARVWTQPAITASVDVIRLTSERIATSFGLGMVARRSPTLVVEGRTADAVVEHATGTFTVGPAWPRVQEVGGAPAYVSAAAAAERLVLAFAFDLVGENRGVLDVDLAELPASDGAFLVTLDASDPSAHYEDSLTLALGPGAAQLRRLIDPNTEDADPASDDTVTFDAVQAASTSLSWRGGVMTAEASDGAVAVREVLQFPLLAYVGRASLGSGRASATVEPPATALRRIRISGR